MEIIAVLAVAIILWMLWQLYRARQFNQFKQFINTELKPLVSIALKQRLEENRDELHPNTEAHLDAATYFWCQYPSRILQAAIAWQVLDENWIEKSGNKRHCQHLFFIERDKLATFVEPIPTEE